MITWRDGWWGKPLGGMSSPQQWVLCPGAEPHKIRHLVSDGAHFIYCDTEKPGELSSIASRWEAKTSWYVAEFKDLIELLKNMSDKSIVHIDALPASGLIVSFDEVQNLDTPSLTSEQLVVLLNKLQAFVKPEADRRAPLEQTFSEESLVSELAKLRRENRYYKVRIDRIKRNPLVRLAFKGRALFKRLRTMKG